MYWIYLNTYNFRFKYTYTFVIAILAKNYSLNINEENKNRIFDFSIVNNFIILLFWGSIMIYNNNTPWICLAKQLL